MTRFKWDNLILFVEQLSAALKLNLPVDRAVQSLSREALDPEWRKAQESVAELLALGSPLSEAMGNYPKFFPPMLRRMVRAGEEGNVLSPMLAAAGRYLQSARELQQRLQKCLVYPMIVWIFLMIDFAILLYFVIPKVREIQESLGAPLPEPTEFFVRFGPMLFLLVIGLLFYLAWMFIGSVGTEMERESRWAFAEPYLVSTPFLGSLQRHARAAQVCEVLGVLVRGGNSGREAVAIAKESVVNPLLRHTLDDVESALAAGEAYEIEPRRTLVPQTTLWMLSEKQGAGELGATLETLSEYHRRQLEVQSAIVRDILEPFLLLSVALIGGFGIFSMFLPIMKFAGLTMMFRM